MNDNTSQSGLQARIVQFEDEREKLDHITKSIGDELITISTLFSKDMETWNEYPVLPNGLSHEECVGLITKETSEADINFVLDIQAPLATSDATMRLWAIKKESTDGVEHFSNIQLTFVVDPPQARVVVAKGRDANRDDLRTALHHGGTHLLQCVIHNRLGIDQSSAKFFGDQLDIVVAQDAGMFASQKSIMLDEESERPLSIDEVNDMLLTVLGRFKSA